MVIMTAPQTAPVQRLRYLDQVLEERRAELRTVNTDMRAELRKIETKVQKSRRPSTSKAEEAVNEAQNKLSRYMDKMYKRYNEGVTTGDVILDYVFCTLPSERYQKAMELYAKVEQTQNELNNCRQWVAVVPEDNWPGDIQLHTGRTFRIGKVVDNGPVLVSGKGVGELCVNTNKQHTEYIDTTWGKKHPKIVKDNIQLSPETEIEIFNLRAALEDVGGEETRKMLGLDELSFNYAPSNLLIKRLTF